MIEEIETQPVTLDELQRRTWPRLLACITAYLDLTRPSPLGERSLADDIDRECAVSSFHEFKEQWDTGCNQLGLDPVETGRELAGWNLVERYAERLPKPVLPFEQLSRMLDDVCEGAGLS